MIRAALSMFSGGITRWAVYGLILAIVWGHGNLTATQRAKEEQAQLLLQESANRQRENHLQLVAWYRDRMKELRLAREQQEGADTAAYAVLEKGKADAEAAAQQARASLRVALGEKQELEMTNEGLRNVSEMLAAEARAPGPGCSMPPRVRQSINGYIARLNSSPAVGGAQAASAGASQSPPGADQVLTCVELADSVIDILQTAGGYIARDASWQEWSDKALK